MDAPHGSHGGAPVLTEHERFKARSRRRFWVGMGVAGGIHVLFFLWGPGLHPGSSTGEATRPEMRALRLLPAEVIERPVIRRPAPPPPLARRAPDRQPDEPRPERRVLPRGPVPRPPSTPLPVADPAEEVAEWIAAAHEMASAAPQVAPPPLPAPAGPPSDTMEHLSGYRHVNALMQKPELVNRAQIRRALLKEYPRELQRAGVEGSVVVWFWIDEKGKVQHYEIRVSSGRPELDSAAERVIPKMKFRPAKERGKPIPVIVALPITFEVEAALRWW